MFGAGAGRDGKDIALEPVQVFSSKGGFVLHTWWRYGWPALLLEAQRRLLPGLRVPDDRLKSSVILFGGLAK